MATYDVKQIALPGGDIANLKDGNAIHKSSTSGFVKNDGSIDQNTYQIAQEGKGLSTNDFTNEDKALIGQTLGNNTVLTTDKTPFLTRQTLNPTGFSGYVREKLVGASYAWNQLVQNGNFASTSNWTVSSGTFAVSGNIGSLVGAGYVYQSVSMIQGHTYLVTIKSKTTNTSETTSRLYYGTANNYINITVSGANAWNTVQRILVCTGTLNRFDLYASAGVTNNYADLQVTDLTLAFGSTIADHLYGLSNNGGITKLRDMGFPIDKYTPYGYGLYSVKTSGKRITINSFTGLEQKTRAADGTKTDLSIRCISKDFYDLKAGKTYVLFAKTSDVGKTLRCSWQTWANKNNSGNTRTYDTGWLTDFPIVITPTNDVIWTCTFSYSDESEIDKNHITVSFGDTITFSLGNDELRGKFDLVNGEIVASGDVKESNGEVTRNWSEPINLGSLNWVSVGGSQSWAYFEVVSPTPTPKNYANGVCAIYEVSQVATVSEQPNKSIRFLENKCFIKDTSYTDAATLISALNGVYAQYELATPTTEQSTPFADPMSLVGATTEEYIDTRDIPCPVGAERQYMGQSEDIIEIPSMPQSDGIRYMKAITSGGKTQLVWEDSVEDVSDCFMAWDSNITIQSIQAFKYGRIVSFTISVVNSGTNSWILKLANKVKPLIEAQDIGRWDATNQYGHNSIMKTSHYGSEQIGGIIIDGVASQGTMFKLFGTYISES